MTSLPSLISLTNLVSLPSHFWTWTNLSPSRVTVDWETRHMVAIPRLATTYSWVIQIVIRVRWDYWKLFISPYSSCRRRWSHQTPPPAWRRSLCFWRCSACESPPCRPPGWWSQSVWSRFRPVGWRNPRLGHTGRMKHISTLRPKTKIKANDRLTERFHVIVEILAVHQLPGCTEGVDHGDGFSGAK